MKYKRKHRHAHKRDQAKERRADLKGWTYGMAIAQESVLRRIFKKEKVEVI